MDRSKTNKVKRIIFPMLLGSFAWMTCMAATPVNADPYLSGCEPLVCVDRNSVLATLEEHDYEGKANPSQLTICHRESNKKSGDEHREHTIRVDSKSEEAHLKHGDTVGSCGETVMQAYVRTLPTCSVMQNPDVEGVWVPENAIGHGTGLNIYFFQVQSGECTGVPDGSAKIYRVVRGQ